MRRSNRAFRAAVAVSFAASTAGLVVGTSLLFTAHAETSSITVVPTDDSYINSAARTTTFGADPTMRSNGAKNKKERAYLKFTVPPLPDGATVVGATLTVTATNSPNIKPALRRQPNNSWSESTLTWNNAPVAG